MSDVLTPAQRHRCMSHIRSKATKPEILVRKWLWAHGYRYRLNVKSVPGKPDFVMRKKKIKKSDPKEATEKLFCKKLHICGQKLAYV